MFDKPKHMDDGSIYLQMKKLTSPPFKVSPFAVSPTSSSFLSFNFIVLLLLDRGVE